MALDRAEFYDAELRRLDAHFRAALKVGPHDRVLDVGCGAGQSTREAARAAPAGSVLGVDVSEDMLRVARRRAEDEGLRNVAFEQGDAQVQAFPAAHFDVCISRFGTMFFADPAAAFANIGRAMAQGGRLVQMVWQARGRNAWATAIPAALASAGVRSGGAAPAFSLGDRAETTRLLTAAGFVSVDFAEVHEPVFYGPTVDAACEAILDLFVPKDGPRDAGVRASVRALAEAHATADGVFFDSRAWIVTARRIGSS